MHLKKKEEEKRRRKKRKKTRRGGKRQKKKKKRGRERQGERDRIEEEAIDKDLDLAAVVWQNSFLVLNTESGRENSEEVSFQI